MLLTLAWAPGGDNGDVFFCPCPLSAWAGSNEDSFHWAQADQEYDLWSVDPARINPRQG